MNHVEDLVKRVMSSRYTSKFRSNIAYNVWRLGWFVTMCSVEGIVMKIPSITINIVSLNQWPKMTVWHGFIIIISEENNDLQWNYQPDYLTWSLIFLYPCPSDIWIICHVANPSFHAAIWSTMWTCWVTTKLEFLQNVHWQLTEVLRIMTL